VKFNYENLGTYLKMKSYQLVKHISGLII